MICGNCKKKTGKNSISAAGSYFCSDVCHLTFWKDEMPNLGGRLISDKEIVDLANMTGPERKEKYDEICRFVLDNFSNTALMLRIKFGEDPYLKD